MKIYEVEFNAPAPTKKQISVPLNTNYGVDVSMVCNGEKATKLSVSIDDVDYPTNVVQLKSGAAAKAEVKEVTAICTDGSMTIHFSADAPATITFTDL